MKPENQAKRDALKRLEHVPNRKGSAELKKYLAGEKITVKQAVLAKCYECCGYYRDGRENCGVYTCPLFPFMPFPPKQIDC
jgi:hypothetical protein